MAGESVVLGLTGERGCSPLGQIVTLFRDYIRVTEGQQPQKAQVAGREAKKSFGTIGFLSLNWSKR